jgi:hypothetical protein
LVTQLKIKIDAKMNVNLLSNILKVY